MIQSVFIVAAERSGDDLGAGLISELRTQAGDSVTVYGIGGSAMAGLGVSSDIDISPLSVFGFTEGLKALPAVYDRVRQTAELIMAKSPDAVILIDSWGFMMRTAQKLGKVGYNGKIIKYVAPQVFAMREGRAKILADGVDHLMTIHNFDAPYFERHGLPVTYVGNPVFDTDYRSGDGVALRNRLNIPSGAPVVGVFFGSRLSEVQRLSRPFADAVEILRDKQPDIRFLSPVSTNVAEDVMAAAGADLRLQDVILLPEAEKLDIFAASNAALACSGTVTTQLASAGVPTVAAYKLSALTHFFGKRMLKTDYVSLVNIAADRSLIPEFIQEEARGDYMAEAIWEFVSGAEYAKETSEALLAQTKIMKGEGGVASARAAKTVLDLLVD